jgi:3-oxoacyl-[acyl-carrier-protein] synthase-3
VLTAAEKPGFITSAYLADGSYADYWVISSGGTAEPASIESVQAGRTKVRLLQRYPPDVNHDNWPRIVRRLSATGGFDIQDIDLAIFTQVNLASIKLVMENLGLPLEKTHWIMEEWGYMGSACIPMALDDAMDKGKVKPGDLLVLVGSGVGYNYAGVALRMP